MAKLFSKAVWSEFISWARFIGRNLTSFVVFQRSDFLNP
jgi:hypothetical protein